MKIGNIISQHLKFKYFEKATKIGQNLQNFFDTNK